MKSKADCSKVRPSLMHRCIGRLRRSRRRIRRLSVQLFNSFTLLPVSQVEECYYNKINAILRHFQSSSLYENFCVIYALMIEFVTQFAE